MRTPTKFVEKLSDEQQSRLQAVIMSDAPLRTRMRAHAVLLSARRFSIDRIADIYEADRDWDGQVILDKKLSFDFSVFSS